MKLFMLTAAIFAANAHSTELLPESVWRCGNEYTNAVTKEQAKHCKRITPKPLSNGERIEYQKCKTNSAKSPTELGVRGALAVCNEQFEQ